VVVPLEFGSRYYGNLALSQQKPNYFRGADVELIQGLAKQLAITIYRLETAEAQREAEQRATEAEVMSSLGQSTIELSHRLANDLGLIRSYVNNIRRTLKSSDISNSVVNDNLEKIVKDVDIVLELSKGLKQELASLRKDGVEIRDKVLIPVSNLLSEIALSGPSLPANVEVRFDVHREVESVTAVLSQVKDTLRNLFVNAVEALPAGGTITLGARNAGEYVNVYVKDSGAGIEPGRQLRIFDLFYSTKGGFGFGLWSARRNALANGGDLTVESQPGKGTTFSLLLKRSPQEED
jgi:signal transduction histidine kinase